MTSPARMPQPGDVLLFAHATGWNRVITLLTHSRFYHVAIYAGDFHVIEARPQGVVSRDLRGPEGTHFCAVLPNPDGKGLEALAWAKSQIGGKYDRWDILVIVLEHIFTHLHLNYAPPGRFSCGEFVARAFEEVGVHLFPGRDAADIVPADFGRLFTCRYAAAQHRLDEIVKLFASDNHSKTGIIKLMATTYKTRSAQEPGLVSLEPLLPSLGAVWTIGAFGRQRLYILSGKFGPDRQFCSRYVVFPEPSGLGHWRFHVLTGKQDYTKGRLDILQERLLELPDDEGNLEHGIVLGTAPDAQQAQRECVEHAIASGNGKQQNEED